MQWSQARSQLCGEPRVEIARQVLSVAEAAHLIALARDDLREAGVSLDSGIGKSSGRTAWNAWIEHDHDAVVQGLCQRLAALAGHPLDHAESLQVVYYAPGGEYRAHYDAYDVATERGQRYTARGGQRLCTAILYLNDVDAGGRTRFPRLDLSIRPELGNVLIFDSCEVGSRQVHPSSLHASEPLEAGEKWIANLWFRERPYR
ncbi:2OG-Fe(II) oxygenase [Algiphilus sp.]|uniref:prolyl hydroxylase family protein n=1 Tax=Algiphilus sp. TaxID=1872431 RepID=UPI001CA72A51|nr:2OG-Fe(II) oxygenase [Algiphilus sp.]MBY8965626.1 2OG-Fe(II) oxygenase [Algiphilus acroporae]MCI5062599.1 2OG-Fe(II) oxygenase [Algiphilus sp.]MCI5103899.1 2OG-Fe(II) oxygenase [Algiphilus sp.]